MGSMAYVQKNVNKIVLMGNIHQQFIDFWFHIYISFYVALLITETDLFVPLFLLCSS